LLRRATAVSTITEAMRQRIIERGVPAERAWLTPNWANLDQVTPGDRDNAFRHDIGLNSAHLLFMYAGNMGVKQGLEVVLDAAAILKEDPRVRFVLIGGGAARMALQEKLGEMQLPNVQMHPVQPKEKLNDMLAAADVHLVVQRREAADLVMPSKLTNILAAGRPSIATADAETTLSQVLLQNKCGLVARPETARSLATAVRHLARDREMRERFGYNARQYAEKALRQDAILKDFERRLIDLVTGGGKPSAVTVKEPVEEHVDEVESQAVSEPQESMVHSP
jgi:colanic acid biosynthesis glycosyl transferase WcaI